MLPARSEDPQIVPPLKNKSKDRGVFFRPKKCPSKTPRLPRMSPRPHHQKTTSSRRPSPKTPCKTAKIYNPNHTPKKSPGIPTDQPAKPPAHSPPSAIHL